jgi:glycosyltransferase involved in cell wall biosynthesis
LTVDPDDPDKIAWGMKEIVAHGPLCSKLVDAGLRRVKQFTWAEAARKYLEIYRSV